ncbi:hypothetical protein SCAR479_06396 [Seiridium cardinale]|uniref:Uncharacterized protein n=1 Tax=Seiridium cardinale TaxID=138064 RepID=A0ABR2XTT8_9PEZI
MKPGSMSEEDHYVELFGLTHFSETLKVARYYELHPSHPLHTFAVTLDSMRKLYVYITVLYPSDVDDILPAIGRRVTLLENIGEIHRLNVKFDDRFCKTRGLHYILKNFGLLRKAEYLTTRMTGSAPVDMLPKMLKALEVYIQSTSEDIATNRNINDLRCQIDHAANHGDQRRFRKLRNQIIEEVGPDRASSWEDLFEHDAKEASEGRSDCPSIPEP